MGMRCDQATARRAEHGYFPWGGATTSHPNSKRNAGGPNVAGWNPSRCGCRISLRLLWRILLVLVFVSSHCRFQVRVGTQSMPLSDCISEGQSGVGGASATRSTCGTLRQASGSSAQFHIEQSKHREGRERPIRAMGSRRASVSPQEPNMRPRPSGWREPSSSAPLRLLPTSRASDGEKRATGVTRWIPWWS